MFETAISRILNCRSDVAKRMRLVSANVTCSLCVEFITSAVLRIGQGMRNSSCVFRMVDIVKYTNIPFVKLL